MPSSLVYSDPDGLRAGRRIGLARQITPEGSDDGDHIRQARRGRWGSVVADHESGAPLQVIEHHIARQIRTGSSQHDDALDPPGNDPVQSQGGLQVLADFKLKPFDPAAALVDPEVEVSRPEELHLRPLAELCMRLSPHTSSHQVNPPPIVERLVCCTHRVLLLPVVSRVQPPDPIPLLQSHYSAFIAPTDRSAPVLRIGTLASWWSPLGLLPWHRSDWFLQFRTRACVRVTPPLRRSPPAQSSGSRQAYPRR